MTTNRRNCLWLTVLALAGVLAGGVQAEPTGRPIPIIFDTDVGNDVDDVLALGMIHALESRGECKLLAVTITKDHDACAPFVDAVNTFYGRGDIPIGVVRGGVTPEPSEFLLLAEKDDGGQPRYPHDLATGKDAPEAVALLREVLAAADDGSVVIVQVGFSTNLARLLESGADEFSDLAGSDLVHKKVRLLSVMAGAFAPINRKPHKEYNIYNDVTSAQMLFAKWPTPIVFSGFEIGYEIRYPAESILQDYDYVDHHPLAESYRIYCPPPHNRPSWDLTSVLYAVYPNRSFFALSPPGRVAVDDEGFTSFTAEEGGPHRYLTVDAAQRIRVREALVQLSSQPPTCLPSATEGTVQ